MCSGLYLRVSAGRLGAQGTAPLHLLLILHESRQARELS